MSNIIVFPKLAGDNEEESKEELEEFKGGSRKGLDETLKTLPPELIAKINFYNSSRKEILKILAEETYIDETQVLHLSPSFQFLFPGMQRFSIPLHEFMNPDGSKFNEVKLGEYDFPVKMLEPIFDLMRDFDDIVYQYESPDHENINFTGYLYSNPTPDLYQTNGVLFNLKNIYFYIKDAEPDRSVIRVLKIEIRNNNESPGGEIVAYIEEFLWPFSQNS